MRPFDLEQVRHVLTGPHGIQFDLRANYDKARSVGGLGGNAAAMLTHAVKCYLVGFDQAARQILEKAQRWLQDAIANSEKPQDYFADATEAMRYRHLSLCRWLLDGRHDAESLRLFVEYQDRYLLNSGACRDKVSICLELPTYVDAEAYENALLLFSKPRGLKPPVSLSKIQNEGQMAYVLCLHRLGHNYSGSEIGAALERFLKRKMDHWLGDGHATRAAEWMKIAYWNQGDKSVAPSEIVRKALSLLK